MGSSHLMYHSENMSMSCTAEEIQCKFAVVGGGIAGVSCVEALAVWAPNAKVVLVSASPVVKTATRAVQITKTLTELQVGEVQVQELEAKHAGLQVVTDTVVGFAPDQQTLHTAQGRTIHYEKLCVCTGARPKLIASDHPHVIGIRDTDSVVELAQKVSQARRIAIVGNGGIATEIVYEVRGVEKVWIVKDDHISKAFVDAGASEFFRTKLVKSEGESATVVKRQQYTAGAGGAGPALGPDWHAHLGIQGSGSSDVTVEYETNVSHLAPGQDGFPVRVHLTNGKAYDCDLVVSATGVVPHLGPFASLTTGPDGAISVNWRMETSAPDVYAAGDACSAAWPWAQHWLQMRLWTQARQMGMFAAQCMAAPSPQELLQDFCFEIFSHVTKFFGYKVVLLGLFNGQKLDKYELLLRMTKGKEYVKLVLKDGRLQGCVLIGDTDLEEMCENLILNQLDLSPYGEDLLNPDIDIEDYFD